MNMICTLGVCHPASSRLRWRLSPGRRRAAFNRRFGDASPRAGMDRAHAKRSAAWWTVPALPCRPRPNGVGRPHVYVLLMRICWESPRANVFHVGWRLRRPRTAASNETSKPSTPVLSGFLRGVRPPRTRGWFSWIRKRVQHGDRAGQSHRYEAAVNRLVSLMSAAPGICDACPALAGPDSSGMRPVQPKGLRDSTLVTCAPLTSNPSAWNAEGHAYFVY